MLAEKKRCAMCEETLPVDQFDVVLRRGRYTYHSYCKTCRVENDKAYKRQYRWRKLHGKREAQDKAILEQTKCDACGCSGAEWFWRNLKDLMEGFEDYVVLHKECREEAIAKGLIKRTSKLQHKKKLQK